MMNMMQNKRVVIIGGTSGIGLESAKLAIAHGAQVVITGLEEKGLSNAIAEIGKNTQGFVLDVTHEKEVQSFFSTIGKFDFLTVPGSTTPKGEFLTMDTQIAKTGFESKFWGQYYAAKYAMPFIQKDGAIVFFSGIISQRPEKNLSVMAAVNSAVEGLGRALAIELAPIRVNVLAPGIVDTPRYNAMPVKDREAMYKKLSEKLPVSHIGSPLDLAQAVVFLMTNNYMTGQTLYVDGGHSLS